jgi:hypothetical protein
MHQLNLLHLRLWSSVIAMLPCIEERGGDGIYTGRRRDVNGRSVTHDVGRHLSGVLTVCIRNLPAVAEGPNGPDDR